ncbi:hypothetical protein ACJJTC_012023 [Scirpophaga incertulas]
MGVTGLWRLIEPTGKPVPVETLENKVLAVDISIWLHQMVKGYQDAKGAPLPNAHLMGLFQRLCKLLYFKIKPVFVFDGDFPLLKKETINKRQENKAKYSSESERLKRELALLLSKKTAINSLLGKNISPKKNNNTNVADDIFILPALPEKQEETESESENEKDSSGSIVDLHSVDIESEKFKNLPAKEKYDLLLELKETRKMNSWGKIHELPKKSDRFSDFQMQRLLKRRKVQECLEETEKEIGDGGMSFNDLESLLNETGIDTTNDFVPTRRIASNNTTRYLLISNVKQALEEAKQRDIKNMSGPSKEINSCIGVEESKVQDELNEDLQKAIDMSLGSGEGNDTNNYISKTDDSWTSLLTDSENSMETDSEDQHDFDPPDMSSAKAYIMQYTDFTNKAIDNIICSKSTVSKRKTKKNEISEILEELNHEKSVITDQIELSSDDDLKDNSKSNTETLNNVSMDNLNVNEESLNKTQASILLIEDEEKVIDLDSTIEEDDKELNVENKSLKSNVNPKTELREINDYDTMKLNTHTSSIEELDEDLQRAIKMSLECVDHHKAETQSDTADDKSIKTISSSNSSDNEFEEVSSAEVSTNKTVVQLTLDIKNNCELKDDIFADIFAADVTKNELCITSVKENESLVNSNDAQNVSEMSNLPHLNISSKLVENISVKASQALNNEINIVNGSSNLPIVNTTPASFVNTNIEKYTKTTVKHQEKTEQIKNHNNSNSEKVINMESNSTQINSSKTAIDSLTTEKLNELSEEMASEERNLLQEKGRLDRIGRNITEQMTKDAQELLQIFGIPFIVAPMEAEAQCAFLENVKLTDGTITDDSDIWLFGGKTVYKNFFNQKKHVLQFLSERIERSFNMSREELVLLALLVGSDYTTGVDGVGPVTAMEILASFPFNKKQYINDPLKQGKYAKLVTGLQEFKKWIQGGKRTDNNILKKKLKNVSLSEEFPSVRVVQAYMEPTVEKSEETFLWGELDITILRDYTKTKFGWSQNKLDEIIKPVLKRMTERKSQKTLQDYFKRTVEYPSLDEHLSKRVIAAVRKLDPDISNEDVLDEPVPVKKSKISTKSNKNKSKNKDSLDQPGTSKVKITPELSGSNAFVSSIMSSKSSDDIVIPKTGRFQEMIPQREKDKKCLFENKLRAIEVFRKTSLDRKRKPIKRRALQPKAKANLSESSDSS